MIYGCCYEWELHKINQRKILLQITTFCTHQEDINSNIVYLSDKSGLLQAPPLV